MEVLALIPARSGSKSVKNKNIREVAGKPMLAWSVEHAKGAKLVNRVILSTDSEEYAAIGRQYGAETPFLRPDEFATDTALDLDVFRHALTWLEENEGYSPDIVVQLRPTYPKRDPADIDRMIELLINDPEADSVRSVAPSGEIPYKMWRLNGGVLTPLLNDIKESYNMPRQELPTVYYQNACIDVFRASTVMKKNSMTGDKILGFVMNENLDIDTEAELKKAKSEVLRSRLLAGGKRFVFDIDGVIAKLEPSNDYEKSKPDREMIATVNRLYDAGNTIILHTARGYVTGKDWSELTARRLEEWGVKYHELHFGKPNADYYIDDRMLSQDELRAALKE